MKRQRRSLLSLLAVAALTALSLAGLLVFDARPKLGLDLQGGLSVVLTAQEDADPEVLDQTVEIIRNRVDSIGAQEPDIARSGDRNVIVQLPGISDPERALEIIGKTAQLRFREVLDQAPIADIRALAEAEGLEPGTDAFEAFVAERLAEQGLELTTDEDAEAQVVLASAEGDVLYRLGPAELVGDQVSDAYAQFDSFSGGWMVLLELTGDGQADFGAVTTRLAPVGGQLAIVLDGLVESSPVVQQAITEGSASITGRFTEDEARDLALVLRTGALPIELEHSQVQRVSATLGTASLRAGLLAGFIGLGLVGIYMLVFYRLLGLVTLVGLGVFGVLVLGLIGLIGATRGFSLTLAGTAGLIVSVGIAADSSIIYFERIKDELKTGKTFRSAADRGFRSAFRTNLAGNAVAFAAAIILWWVAIGPVRGFALTLGISVVFDIALLYFFTRPAVALVSRNRTGGGDAMGVEEAT